MLLVFAACGVLQYHFESWVWEVLKLPTKSFKSFLEANSFSTQGPGHCVWAGKQGQRFECALHQKWWFQVCGRAFAFFLPAGLQPWRLACGGTCEAGTATSCGRHRLGMRLRWDARWSGCFVDFCVACLQGEWVCMRDEGWGEWGWFECFERNCDKLGARIPVKI